MACATGYVHSLLNKPDMTFQEFVLNCAPAFGARPVAVDSVSAVFEEAKPDESLQEQLEKHQAELVRLVAMTQQERIAFGEAMIHRKYKANAEYRKTAEAENKVMKAMLWQVDLWQVPEPIKPFKAFMQEQLRSSLNKEPNGLPIPDSAMQAYENAVASAERLAKSYAEDVAKDMERVANANLWLRVLQSALIAARTTEAPHAD